MSIKEGGSDGPIPFCKVIFGDCLAENAITQFTQGIAKCDFLAKVDRLIRM
jgi:hypothetical protein